MPSILVVDDVLENLKVLTALLKQRGYKVRPVANGALALESAGIMPPDLILLDISMPEMNGYEVCERLKADEVLADKAGRGRNELSFHSLRHSFNSAMANAGISQEIRQKLTGHKDMDTNTLYTHLDFPALKSAVDAVPSLNARQGNDSA